MPLPGDRPTPTACAQGVPAAPSPNARRARTLDAAALAGAGSALAPAAPPPAPSVAPAIRTVRYFPWGEDKIWGATERMLEHLLAALRRGAMRL